MAFLIQQVFLYTVPLLIVALAGIYAERSGIINLALEGGMVIGAFSGVLTVRLLQQSGFFTTENGQLLLLIAFVVSGAVGAAFSLLLSFAAVNLKANQTTVDDLGTRVSAAEVAIDGANAEIALKVSKNGVVSAINMSPEGVKISASKIELDGETIANKLLGGYIDVTSIDANEGDITNLYCDTAYLSSLVLNDTGVSLKSKTVVVGQQTLTPSYVTIQYKDHNGNNQYTQVVKAVTINNASTASISYLGT